MGRWWPGDERGLRRVSADRVTSWLELAAVLLLALGLAVVAGGLLGGVVGVGAGCSVAALVLGGASAVLQWLGRPARPAVRRR